MSEIQDTGLPRLLVNNLDRNVCTCYDVSKRQLIEAYMNGAVSFQQLSMKTYACQGSACCEQQVHKLINTLDSLDLVDNSVLKASVSK